MQMYGNFQNLSIELNPSLVPLVLHYLFFCDLNFHTGQGFKTLTCAEV